VAAGAVVATGGVVAAGWEDGSATESRLEPEGNLLDTLNLDRIFGNAVLTNISEIA